MTRRDEQGFTLAELAVATTVLGVVIMMTFFTATEVVKLSVRGTAKGVAAEIAQSQVVVLEQYLRGAISPANAAIEYPAVTPTAPCSSAPVSSSLAVQYAYDYQLQLCSAPAHANGCTSANVNSQGSGCPQWYLISVSTSPSTCASNNQCKLQIQDLSITGSPIVWHADSFRCNSTCQADVGSDPTNNEQKNGASPAFPYLFSYYNASSALIKGNDNNHIQSVWLDMQVVSTPAGPTQNAQIYTELRDTVWLTGAATPQT